MNIIGQRKKFYVLSLILIAVGLGSLMFRGLNLGIDFSSGLVTTIDLKSSFDTGEVRDVLNAFDLGSARIRTVAKPAELGLGQYVEIRTPVIEQSVLNALVEGLQSQWPDAEQVSSAEVSPVFSVELVRQALFALLIASVLMVGYITWRFEFRFAISAILALLHDVFIVLGVFSILQIEVNSEFVAAILTIIGYSINDTIVIFDRIRENLQHAKRRSDTEKVVNDSILQTLVRSINTSFTTLLAIGAVLILGGVTLKPLASALVIGVIAGTYSSIFVASSVWVDWKQREQSRRNA